MPTGITTIEQADSQAAAGMPEAAPLSAMKALGLDESPADSLKTETAKNAKNVPEDKGAKRDDLGRFAKPGEKPAAPAKPAAKPATPVKPATPAPAAPAAPATPVVPKIKIGDKEYTAEEVAEWKRLSEAAAAPKPAAAAAPAAPAAEPVKQPTPEEIQAQEMEFVTRFTGLVGDIPVSEDTLEKILIGGKDGVASLVGLLKTTAARAALETRKTIYNELNPVLQGVRDDIRPLLDNNQQLERAAVQHQFTEKFPEYHGEFLKEAEGVANELVRLYPKEVGQMTREQFLAEVDKQTDRILSANYRRFAPNATTTWRDFAKSQRAASAAPAAPAPAAPAAPAAATPAAPAAPAKPVVKAPSGNSPGAGGAITKDWQKSVAGGLAD